MDQKQTIRDVCFCAFHAYPLFDPREQHCVGGLETHAWQLANALAAEAEWSIQFVVQAPRRFRRRQFGAVTVWNRGDGLDAIRQEVSRCIRFEEGRLPSMQHWHARLLWQLPLLALMRPFRNSPPGPTRADPFYAQIDPDLFCCFGVSGRSASIVATARAADKPSVLFLESNADLDERFGPDSTYVTPYGERGDVCAFAIQHATTIVTQHSRQSRLLRERFNREGHVLPNLIDFAAWDRAAAKPSGLLEGLELERFVLWVGRADAFHKRPRLCLELAQQLKDISFLMILNPSDPDIARQIHASAPANVTIVEAVPFSEMPAVLRHADLLVSTGADAYEGAPNIFLQAAASQTPVASLEVPLPFPEEVGFVADGDLDRLAEAIRNMWDHPDQAREQGRQSRQLIEERHDVSVVVTQLKELLGTLVASTDQ